MNKIIAGVGILAVASSTVLLGGCNEKENPLKEHPVTTEVGVFDRCVVSFVNRGYDNLSFYIARCPGISTVTTSNYTVPSGRTRISKRSTVIAQEIEALQAEKSEAEIRESAVAKLSPAERAALGIK